MMGTVKASTIPIKSCRILLCCVRRKEASELRINVAEMEMPPQITTIKGIQDTCLYWALRNRPINTTLLKSVGRIQVQSQDLKVLYTIRHHCTTDIDRVTVTPLASKL